MRLVKRFPNGAPTKNLICVTIQQQVSRHTTEDWSRMMRDGWPGSEQQLICKQSITKLYILNCSCDIMQYLCAVD